MLKISQSGKSKNVPPKTAKLAVRFFVSQFLTEKQISSINVTLRFVKHTYFVGDPDMIAYCDYNDWTIRPKDFEIVVDKDLSAKKTLICLAHEVVHLKQFYLNELTYHRIGKMMWKNDLVEDDSDYRGTPWELEAERYETDLVKRWNAFLKDGGKLLL